MCEQDSVSQYLKQIRKYPLLNFDEEMELSRLIQSGDLKAQKKLIESNLRLVVTIARKFAAPDLPLLDIIQEGNLGLITAAQKYEHSYKVRFSTYACWWIQQAITRSIANKRRMIRLPFRKEELAARIKRASSELFQKLSRMPNSAELAVYLNLDEADVCDNMRCSMTVSSLDLQIEDDESSCLQDVLPDTTYNPENEYIKKYTHERMIAILSDFSEYERDIMVKRYNLIHDEKAYTLKSLGSLYGVSAETIRQIELRVLRKLKGRSEELRELAYS